MQIELPLHLRAKKAQTPKTKNAKSLSRRPPNPKKMRKPKRSDLFGGPSPRLDQTMVGMAQGSITRSGQPNVRGNPYKRGGYVEVTHREFVDVINGSIAFQYDYFMINPGLTQGPNDDNKSCFTWLPPLASRFEKYQFRQLQFEYVTDCSTTTPGSVFMSVDFDSYDPSPLSANTLMSNEGATRVQSWSCMQYTSAAHNLLDRTPLFCRNGPLAANQDRKTYDLGKLTVATSGQPSTSQIGELYVTYTIRFFNPMLDVVITTPPPPPVGLLYAGGDTVTGSAVNLWSGMVAPPGSTLPFAVIGEVGQLVLPIGSYRVLMYIFGSSPTTYNPLAGLATPPIVVTAITATLGGNGSSYPYYANLQTPSGNAQYLSAFAQFDVTAPGVVSVGVRALWKAAQLGLGAGAPYQSTVVISNIAPGGPLAFPCTSADKETFTFV